MKEITVEQRIQLAQQIRNQSNQNRYDMSARERIVYGNMSYNHAEGNLTDSSFEQINLSASESLKCRGLIAAMLLVFTILFESMGVKPFGVDMEHIFTYISADCVESMQGYIETMVNSADSVL